MEGRVLQGVDIQDRSIDDEAVRITSGSERERGLGSGRGREMVSSVIACPVRCGGMNSHVGQPVHGVHKLTSTLAHRHQLYLTLHKNTQLGLSMN